MRNFIRGFAQTAALLLIGFQVNCLGATVPEWLSTANRANLGDFGKGSAAVVVGQWRTFTVDASGKFFSTERRAVRVLNRRSAGQYLRVAGYENNDESVVSIQAWSLSTSGKVVQSDKKDIVTQSGFADFELFSDSREKIVNIPGAEDGSLVGYEIVREGRLPLRSERFALEDQIPVHAGELTVSVPSGSLRYFINHPDRIEVLNQTSTSATFRSVDRPEIPDEENVPPFWSLTAAVFVNYDPQGAAAIGTWDQAGRQIHPLLSGAEKSNPDIAMRVDDLSANMPDRLAKIDAIYNFVSREIRYVAVEIGVGGFEPHPAADVYRYKYGDCKDKATLLMTMLGHVGLRGYPALVGTRHDVEADPNVPTLASFDHMIVALPVPADLQPVVQYFPAYDAQRQILWIDPTSETDPLGELPEMDQGVFALISFPDRGELLRIPEGSAEHNGLEYQVNLRLDSSGRGLSDVQVKYLGGFNAYRHLFYRTSSQSQIRTMFEERVARYANQSAFRTASITGVEANNMQIAEKYSFMGDFASAASGDSWYVQPFFLSGMSLPEIGLRPRVSLLDLGALYQLKGTYRLELPPDMRFERLPEKLSLRTDYGTLEVEYAATANVLLVKEIMAFTSSRIPPDKYNGFRDFVNVARHVNAQRLHVQKLAE